MKAVRAQPLDPSKKINEVDVVNTKHIKYTGVYNIFSKGDKWIEHRIGEVSSHIANWQKQNKI